MTFQHKRLADFSLDPAQQKVAAALDTLRERLMAGEKGFWLTRLWVRRPKQQIRGLYIHGGVGRGKTMLMDDFYRQIPFTAKKRLHFHDFMVGIHERLHILRHTKPRPVDPVEKLADEIAAETRLLCFDEFHVTNIADAMILGRLFAAFWARGMVIVVTSNWAPDALYQNGLQRDRFLPFIALLKERMDIIHLDDGRDYRLGELKEDDFYIAPCDSGAESRWQRIFLTLSGNKSAEPITLSVQSRTVTFAKAYRHLLLTDFTELCSRALGAIDYLAISKNFSLIMLGGVPLLTFEKRDETKRFMTFVDIVYEARRQLIICAAAEPEALLQDDHYQFEFQRTISRLSEMRRADYQIANHTMVSAQ